MFQQLFDCFPSPKTLRLLLITYSSYDLPTTSRKTPSFWLIFHVLHSHVTTVFFYCFVKSLFRIFEIFFDFVTCIILPIHLLRTSFIDSALNFNLLLLYLLLLLPNLYILSPPQSLPLLASLSRSAVLVTVILLSLIINLLSLTDFTNFPKTFKFFSFLAIITKSSAYALTSLIIYCSFSLYFTFSYCCIQYSIE